ncbi:ABC transporter permease [Nonomuraea sp. NPDC050310]|uniref:ABC transporter permease n=1 Tax=Nonomuraea sp. NPDC050310 TaxID=3154935 RepID=UPI0033CA99A4
MTGTRELIRLALRQDRVLLPAWILLITAAVTGTASAIAELYPGMTQRVALGVTIGQAPAIQALTGPVFDSASVGGLTAWRATTPATVLVALMSVFLITRHTRAEEESGRAELVGSCPVGRQALPAAALAVAMGVNLLIGLLLIVTMTALGLPGAGAIAYGLAITVTGWLFCGVAAITAQLTAHARTANGAALAVLGLAFLLRAGGDASGVEALSWASPLGWAQRVRAFAGERWWVLALAALTTALLICVAAALNARRDLGAGLLPPRRGPAQAPPYLNGPFGLAWRLQRGALLGWTLAFAVAGALFGALAQSVGEVIRGNAQLAQILERIGGAGALVDGFLATVIGLLGLVASGFAVQSVLRLHAEETSSRAEAVLAGAVPRSRWAAAHLIVAFGGPVVILATGGLAMGLVHGIRSGDPSTHLLSLAGAAWVQLPAVWVLAGLAMLLYGTQPRLVSAAWAALVVFALLGQLGEVLRLPEWVQLLSPYAHLPQVPGGPIEAAPLIWLGGLALALVGLGVAGFRRRDLA